MNPKQIYLRDWGTLMHPGAVVTSHYANLLLNFICLEEGNNSIETNMTKSVDKLDK